MISEIEVASFEKQIVEATNALHLKEDDLQTFSEQLDAAQVTFVDQSGRGVHSIISSGNAYKMC